MDNFRRCFNQGGTHTLKSTFSRVGRFKLQHKQKWRKQLMLRTARNACKGRGICSYSTPLLSTWSRLWIKYFILIMFSPQCCGLLKQKLNMGTSVPSPPWLNGLCWIRVWFLMLHITPLWGDDSYNHCMQLQSLMLSCIVCKTEAPTLKKVWKCIGTISESNASLAGTITGITTSITRDICESLARTLIQPRDQIVWFCQAVGHFTSL